MVGLALLVVGTPLSDASSDMPILEAVILGLTLVVTLAVLVRRYRSRRMLTQRVEELTALAEIGRYVATAPLEEDELAETAYEEAARVFKTDFFQLGVFEGRFYRTVIWVRDGERVENDEFEMRPEQDGLVGWIRQNGNPLLVSDFASERDRLPARPSYDAEDPPASGIFAPLLAGEEVLGLIGLQSRRKRAFTDHDLRLLTILANAVASSMALARLQTRTEFRTLQLALIKEISEHLTSLQPLPELFAQVSRLIAHTLDYPAVRLFEITGGNLLLRSSSVEGAATGPVGASPAAQAAAEQGQTVVRSAAGGQEEPAPAADETRRLLAAPLKVEDRVLGVLEIESDEDFPDEHVALAETLAAHLAIAVLEAHNFSQQQEEAWITTVLVEVARHAARPGDAMEALQAVLQLTTLLAGTTWALLLLPEAGGDRLALGPTSGLRRQVLDQLAELRLAPDALGVHGPYESEAPLHVSLPEELAGPLDNQHATGLTLTDGKSLLAVLLLEGQELVGRRLSLLVGIGHQISLRLENTRLVDEAAARRSLEREIAMARGIQESFLPNQVPDHPGWQLGATWRVAREVGGDFYDFIPLPAGPNGPRWGIAIADVADKGVPAALFMALCRTLLRSVAISRIDPGKTLTRLNDLIIADTKTDLFVSVFYAVWEPEAGRMSYANAGHNPPLLFEPGTPAISLHEHGMVLGVEPGRTVATRQLAIPPNALLLLYTDGVTEATDSQGHFFGVHRLENLVLGLEDWHAQTVADSIAERVSEFIAEPDLPDDLTIVTLRRLAPVASEPMREADHGD